MRVSTERQRAPSGGRKPDPSTAENRKTALAYIRDHGPCKTCDIRAATGFPAKALDHYLYWLSTLEFVRSVGGGASARWVFVRDMVPSRHGTQTVNLPDQSRWLAPAAVVEVRDGITYTRQAAPRGRFEVDVKPGAGVISYDNPGLARLAAP